MKLSELVKSNLEWTYTTTLFVIVANDCSEEPFTGEASEAIKQFDEGYHVSYFSGRCVLMDKEEICIH